MRVLVACLALIAAAPTVQADRLPYRGRVTLTADGPGVRVEHRHDWGKLPRIEDGWRMEVTTRTPFGVDAEVSSIDFYVTTGALVSRLSSPPLTHLSVSADGRYVIGLSNIKVANGTQLVVFDPKGSLLLRRHVSSSGYCFTRAQFDAWRARHREAFAEVQRVARQIGNAVGWQSGNRIYLDYLPRMDTPAWNAMWDDLPAPCDSPYSASFGESVSNFIFWYHPEHPRPVVIERDGRPLELRVRDRAGVEFSIPFAMQTL